VKKSFLTGVFVLVPLVVSVTLLLWFFEKVDSLFSPVLDGVVRALFPGTDHVPGTGILAGLVIILLLGTLARNVVGKRLLDAMDRLIQRIPGYRSVYSTIKQLTNAFSPENTQSFKEVLLVEFPKEGSYALGFRTMTVEDGDRRLVVVYVPTNNLYLGEVLFIPEGKAVRLDMSIEQAVRLLMSGGSPRRINCGGWGRGLTTGSTDPYACRIMMSATRDRQEVGLTGLALLRPRRAGPEPEHVAHQLRRFGPRGRQVPAVFCFSSPREPIPRGFSFWGGEPNKVREH